MLKLVIDNRETKIIELYKSNKKCDIETKNLEIGDFHIYNDDKLIIIIERKTLKDLGSSIKDGRYKEQKNRLLKSVDINVKRIYIIESNNYYEFGLPEKTLWSVIVNTLLRDHIYIIKTDSIIQTIEYLDTIMNNIPKYLENVMNEKCENDIENNFSYKTCKKNNINSKICFENMLKQIPGISDKISNIISNKFNNMYSFINNIGNDKETFIKEVGEIKSENRKVGKKTAENIYNFIYT